jgi:hypothetical protein
MRPLATMMRPHSTVSVYQVYQGSPRRRPTFGANLVSVQRLLGHSDPKITERRYSHFSPDFMSAEVNRLRFGLPALAPNATARTVVGRDWQWLAARSRRWLAAWYTGGTVGGDRARRRPGPRGETVGSPGP